MNVTDPVEMQYLQAQLAEFINQNLADYRNQKGTNSGSEVPFQGANNDSVSISDEAHALFRKIEDSQEGNRTDQEAERQDGQNDESNENSQSAEINLREKEDQLNGKELSDQDRQKAQDLHERDQKVRSHEQAHKAAAGSLPTSGPNYTYQTGPDGQQYAVGGEVNIGMPASDDPKENLKNAQQLERAARAPAEPSPQDRKVAASARQKQQKAQQEIAEKQSENLGLDREVESVANRQDKPGLIAPDVDEHTNQIATDVEDQDEPEPGNYRLYE